MLITTNQELKKYLGNIQKNLSIETMQAYISDAEEMYIIPLLSQEEFDILQIKYDNPPVTPLAYEQLLVKVQKSIANYAIHDYVKTGMTTKGDAGIKEHDTEDLTQARQWVIYDELNHYITKADAYADNFLAFLEANKDIFTDWANSDAYTNTVELLINSAEELNKIVNIAKSRRAFLKLRTFIRLAEEKYLQGVMGFEQIEFLKDKFKASQFDDFSTQEKFAWGLMKKSVAYYAIDEASPQLTIKAREDGIFVIPTIENGNRRDLEVSKEKTQVIASKHKENGDLYLHKLQGYLNANPDDFPIFKDSVHYTSPPTKEEIAARSNDNLSSIFSF